MKRIHLRKNLLDWLYGFNTINFLWFIFVFVGYPIVSIGILFFTVLKSTSSHSVFDLLFVGMFASIWIYFFSLGLKFCFGFRFKNLPHIFICIILPLWLVDSLVNIFTFKIKY